MEKIRTDLFYYFAVVDIRGSIKVMMFIGMNWAMNHRDAL